MRVNRKLWTAATVCVAVAAGVTGCSQGGDDKPADPFAGLTADAIAEKSVQTTKKATSFRMNGTGKTDGKDMTVTFALSDKGVCTGTMAGAGAGKAEIRRIDGVTYMKGDDAFWRASSGAEGDEANAMTALLKGRWMKMPSEGDDNDMGAFCDLKTVVKDMDEDDKERKGLTRGADADVDGAPAVTLTKKGTKDETTTFYVARDAAKPYILRVVKTGGDEPGTVTLGEYDKPVTVTAPPADQVVDMAQLAGAS